MSHTAIQLSSGSTTSLPMLKVVKAPAHIPNHPLEKKRKGRVRRPSSAGAPPPLHVIQQVEEMVPVGGGRRVNPGDDGWEYCGLPVAAEMADGLASEYNPSLTAQ